ncbi:MAG: nucleotide sugar dehydrogenase [Chloroflexota bacterium]|nr:nucleotide sugar dehydrogenase [Chloroflexota bacterium]
MAEPISSEVRAKVCVVGIWHLGAVTCACLADLGYQVVGVDRDQARVAFLNSGEPPLYEPGLQELMERNIASGRLGFTSDLRDGARGAPYLIIAHDTPVNDQDEADLSPITSAFQELAGCAEDGATVVVSSQVPVGTCEAMAATVRRLNPGLRFGIACVPENLRLGQAIERFKRPDMLVIGADTPATRQAVEQLLSPIQAPRVAVNLRTAEMTKHAINAYLALNISFANELANLSDLVGADALQVMQALRLDSRVSPRAPLFPGLGFAGGTLARDLKALSHLGEEHDYEAPLVNGVLRVNQLQNRMVVLRLKQSFGSLQGLEVGVLGLTYKAGTSTLRRSAALEIVRAMAEEGASVKAYDPRANPTEVEPHLRYFTRCASPYDAALGCRALVLVTAWPEFKELDFGRVRASMRFPFLLDAQNMLDADRMVELGFVYQGVGRARAQKTSGGNP